jgi:hypothetical protein
MAERAERDDSFYSVADSEQSGPAWVDMPRESAISEYSETSISEGEPADGELGVLLNSLEEDALPLSKRASVSLQRRFSESLISESGEAIYGHPLSVEEATQRMPPGEDGLAYHSIIIPDKFIVNGKLIKGLDQRDFDVEKHSIKPRRKSLPMTVTDLLSSLTKIKGPNNEARYVFYGVLNGWPSLRCFELVGIDQKRQGSVPSPKDFMSGQILWKHFWKAEAEGTQVIEPHMLDPQKIYRAKLRGAPWTSLGWASTSPGFAFWYEAQRLEGPRVVYGTDMVKTLGDDKCTHVHMVSHRYAAARESPKDRITYHSIVLLEWEHGNFCTVVEAAYLNGIGGYKGKSNWYDDKDEAPNALYKTFPPEMISPWKTSTAELRCYDVKAKTFEEFKVYVEKYKGNTKRFVDPRFTLSHPARLTFRSKSHIAQYLVNYTLRDTVYSELRNNCQTFAADFFSFLVGKKGIAPFHPVNRIEYQNRTYLFLYDSHMYENKEQKKAQKKK